MLFYDEGFCQTLAGMVSEAHLEEGRLYPPLSTVREVSTKLAARIVTYAYEKGLAATYPEPVDKEEFVRKHQYNVDYGTFVPPTYPWPGMPE